MDCTEEKCEYRDGPVDSPDNPDGSGRSHVHLRDVAGHEWAVPYSYAHVPLNSRWRITTLVPMVSLDGAEPVEKPHLNQYHVPGHLLGRVILVLDDPETAERILRVEYLQWEQASEAPPA